jgi:hypothetical protein
LVLAQAVHDKVLADHVTPASSAGVEFGDAGRAEQHVHVRFAAQLLQPVVPASGLIFGEVAQDLSERFHLGIHPYGQATQPIICQLA